MIGDALRGIIDLLKIQKDARKADLEIEKLEREKAEAKSVIQIASFAEVVEYDPHTRRIIDQVQASAGSMPCEARSSETRSETTSNWLFAVIVGSIVIFIFLWIITL